MDQTIISLALLKAQWETNKHDYLETFVPMVVECIRLSDHSAISLPKLTNDMDGRFGIGIPQHALKLILTRLKDKGYINVEHKAYVPVYNKLANSTFAFTVQSVTASHERIIKGIVQFCGTTFNVALTPSDAESALHSFLQTDPSLASGKLLLSSQPIPPKVGPSRDFMIAAFIQYVESQRSADFEHLETIVKGSMLVSALYLPDPARAGRKFKGTDIYFDTSLLIYALGHAGPARQDPCLELLALLADSGVKLSCFSHTFDEISAALNACFIRMEKGKLSGAYGPSMEYFLSEGLGADDVLLKMNHLEADLKALNIYIRPSSQGDDHDEIDEAALKSLLEAELINLNEHAIDRDVKSLACVKRLWKKTEPICLEDAPALFVTTNSVVARVARRFFARMISTSEGDVPRAVAPCITDQSLTTLLWLKRPTQAPNLPRKRLIADCMAAMQPSALLWAKYEDALERLVKKGTLPPDDYYLMRYSREAKRALMDETVGDDEVFVEGTVDQVMDRARRAMLVDTERELAKEREARIVAEGRALEERARREEEVAGIRDLLTRRERETATRIHERALQYAYLATICVHVVVLAILVVGTYSGSKFAARSFQLDTMKSGVIKNTLLIVQAILFLLGVVHLHFGIPVHSPIKRFEAFLAGRIERWLLSVQV